MEAALYLELNLFGIIMLGLLLWNLTRSSASMFDERLFRALLLCVMGAMVVDIFCWEFDGSQSALAPCILTVSNALYFIITGLLCFMWMLYADFKLFSDFEGLKKRGVFYAIPFAALTVISLLTPFTKWVFYIDASNVYHRGPLFAAHSIVSLAMLLYTAVLAIVKSVREPLRSRRGEYRLILLFVFLPVASAVIQSHFYGLALVWMSCAVSLLAIFIDSQNRQISLDGLTNINNRRTLNRYLELRTNELKGDETLHLILLDIDRFKKINDTYGHTMGDAVLIRIAQTLKRVCGRSNDFLARYGGDEFAVVCRDKTDAEVQGEIDAIRAAMHNGDEDAVCPFQISAGYACIRAGESHHTHSIDYLISEADRNMYANKNR